jgi:hypothetical protein
MTVNNTIGTQAALIGGFTYSVFTQSQVNDENSYGVHVNSAYYVVSAVTVAAAIHVIIVTMLLQVLGPGLALNGPVGSIARAAEVIPCCSAINVYGIFLSSHSWV